METALINEKIVFVKTYFVPCGAEFRYIKRWWRKRDSIKAVAVASSTVFTNVPCGQIVAMYKKDLPQSYYVHILKEL